MIFGRHSRLDLSPSYSPQSLESIRSARNTGDRASSRFPDARRTWAILSLETSASDRQELTLIS